MMLRSSSTPILSSLLSSSSSSLQFPCESPKTHHHPFSCHFSPAPDGFHDQRSPLGIRRSHSCGNLHSLVLSDHSEDSFNHLSPTLKRSSSRRAQPALETIPSKTVAGEEEEEEEEEEEIDQMNFDKFVLGELDLASEHQNGVLKPGNAQIGGLVPPLFLARGLGIDRVGSGLLNVGGCDGVGSCGGDGGKCDFVTSYGGEQSDVEMYYKKMVEENPSNALFLRNYAEFLFQTKGDVKRAEEYYSRAILADPGDGEILSKYAKLVWELHGDEERASSYFQQAVHAAPQDSHVLAAYAGFLWNTEEDDEFGGAEGVPPHAFAIESARNGALAPATA